MRLSNQEHKPDLQKNREKKRHIRKLEVIGEP